jgi:hypothetical protein
MKKATKVKAKKLKKFSVSFTYSASKTYIIEALNAADAEEKATLIHEDGDPADLGDYWESAEYCEDAWEVK